MSDDTSEPDAKTEYRFMAKLLVKLYADDVLVVEIDCPKKWHEILGTVQREAHIRDYCDDLLGVHGVVIGGKIVPCPKCSKKQLVAVFLDNGSHVKCTDAECQWTGKLADLEPGEKEPSDE